MWWRRCDWQREKEDGKGGRHQRWAPGGSSCTYICLVLWIHWAGVLEKNPRDGSWVACGENIDLGQGTATAQRTDVEGEVISSP